MLLPRLRRAQGVFAQSTPRPLGSTYTHPQPDSIITLANTRVYSSTRLHTYILSLSSPLPHALRCSSAHAPTCSRPCSCSSSPPHPPSQPHLPTNQVSLHSLVGHCRPYSHGLTWSSSLARVQAAPKRCSKPRAQSSRPAPRSCTDREEHPSRARTTTELARSGGGVRGGWCAERWGGGTGARASGNLGLELLVKTERDRLGLVVDSCLFVIPYFDFALGLRILLSMWGARPDKSKGRTDATTRQSPTNQVCFSRPRRELTLKH